MGGPTISKGDKLKEPTRREFIHILEELLRNKGWQGDPPRYIQNNMEQRVIQPIMQA